MMMCDSHWEALKKALEDRDMMKYTKPGARSVDFQADAPWLDPGHKNYDPLLIAYMAIAYNVVRIEQDTNILTIDECPVCYANRMHKQFCVEDAEERCKNNDVYYDFWIESAAQDEANRMQRHLARTEANNTGTPSH